MIFKTQRGIEVLIDEEDLPLVSKHKWYFDKDGYLRCHILADNRRTMVPMHRIIMGAKKGQIIDHINGNILDNRKENLRFCTIAENCRNSKKDLKKSYSSKYKGVVRNSKDTAWQVSIGINNKHKFIGYYTTEEAAAVAYNLAALEFHKEFASLNNVDMTINPNDYKPYLFKDISRTTKKVYCIYDNKEFNSIRDACEFYKVSYAGVRNALSQKRIHKSGIVYKG